MASADERRVTLTPSDEAAAAAAQVRDERRFDGGSGFIRARTRRSVDRRPSPSLPLSLQALSPVFNCLEPDASSATPWGVRWPVWGDPSASLPPLPAGVPPPPPRAACDAFVATHGPALDAYLQRRTTGEGFRGQGAAPPSAGEGLARAAAAVPAPFFEPDFSLADGGVWALLCDDAGDADARAAGVDRLASLAAVADGALSAEVAARAPRFADAVQGLTGLGDGVGRAAAQAAGARARAATAATAAVASRDARHALAARRRNLTATLALLAPVQRVADARAALAELLPAGDAAGALAPLAELRAAAASAGRLPPALNDIKAEADAAGAAVERLLRGAAARAVGDATAGGGPPPPFDSSALYAALVGAADAGCGASVTDAAAAASRRRAADAVVAAVLAALPAALPASFAGGRSLTSLGDGVAAVDGAGFAALLAAATAGAARAVRAAADARAALAAAPAPPAAAASIAAGGDALVAAAAAGAGGRWADLARARRAALARGPLACVLALPPAAAALAAACAEARVKPARDPDDAVAEAGRAWLDSWAETARAAVAAAVDADDWGGGFLPQRAQDALTALEAAAAPGAGAEAVAALAPAADSSDATPPSPPLPSLRLGDTTYVISTSAALLATHLAAGVAAGASLPALAAPAATRAVALAAAWNAAAAGAVLGARALATVPGLRSLSARRLAVAARSAAFVAAALRLAAAALTSADARGVDGVAGAQLDALQRDFEGHAAELGAKLVALVRERVAAGLATIAADPEAWAAGAPAGAPPPPSAFAADAARHLASLAAAVSPVLAPDAAASVLVRAAAGVAAAAADGLAAAAHAGAGPRAQAAADGGALLAALRALPLPPAELEAAVDPLAALFTPPRRAGRRVEGGGGEGGGPPPAAADPPDDPLPPPADAGAPPDTAPH